MVIKNCSLTVFSLILEFCLAISGSSLLSITGSCVLDVSVVDKLDSVIPVEFSVVCLLSLTAVTVELNSVCVSFVTVSPSEYLKPNSARQRIAIGNNLRTIFPFFINKHWIICFNYPIPPSKKVQVYYNDSIILIIIKTKDY